MTYQRLTYIMYMIESICFLSIFFLQKDLQPYQGFDK